jgi:SAM-dependent methyltransferase
LALHPLARRFAEVAPEYERGRPEYPPAAIGALAAELGLAPGAAVLDLAAGTGKFSRALLAAGFDLVAVEPLPELREQLRQHIDSVRVREGIAEQIPLPDASVDAVTVADAFHWFDQARALLEIRRVLRPGGGLAVVKMVPDWSGASWGHELGSLVNELRPPEHPHFDGPPWEEAVRAAGGWTEPREIRVTSIEPTSPVRIIDHLASMSWIAAMPEEQRAQALNRFRSIMHEGTMPPALPQHVLLGLTRLTG